MKMKKVILNKPEPSQMKEEIWFGNNVQLMAKESRRSRRFPRSTRYQIFIFHPLDSDGAASHD